MVDLSHLLRKSEAECGADVMEDIGFLYLPGFFPLHPVKAAAKPSCSPLLATFLCGRQLAGRTWHSSSSTAFWI